MLRLALRAVIHSAWCMVSCILFRNCDWLVIVAQAKGGRILERSVLYEDNALLSSPRSKVLFESLFRVSRYTLVDRFLERGH